MKKLKIKIGDIYEDCTGHPVKCTLINGDDLEGVSMVDGSSPRCCSIRHCGVIKLSKKEANKLIKKWNKKEAQDFIDKCKK